MDEIVHKVKKDGIGTLFGHIGDKTSEKQGKKYTELQGGMKLSLAAKLVLN
jgi:hypothetical protein